MLGYRELENLIVYMEVSGEGDDVLPSGTYLCVEASKLPKNKTPFLAIMQKLACLRKQYVPSTIPNDGGVDGLGWVTVYKGEQLRMVDILAKVQTSWGGPRKFPEHMGVGEGEQGVETFITRAEVHVYFLYVTVMHKH